MSSIAERHKYILDNLNKNGFIKVADIAHELNVTAVTIRKDLKYLEEKKLLLRTHGSASPVNQLTSELHIGEKEKIKRKEKENIALAACELLEERDTIILTAGSTVYTLAQKLLPVKGLTVVTPSLKVALHMAEMPDINIIQLGGTVRKSSFSVIGESSTNFLANITCSKLFLGVDGIDPKFGITNSSIEEAMLNQHMIETSLKIIILADSSKFGRRGFGKICNLDQIDTIITDEGISETMRQQIEEAGVELIIV
ncbi:MAG: DeoR/GlpR family DNA-binding transcription regulator [Bacteroidales bacterium]